MTGHSGAGSTGRIDWRIFLALFLLAAGIICWRPIVHFGAIPLFSDTDDAMRLVVVRDFLAGQGWYDLVQHRLNTPFGAEIHWSRLVDLPMAGMLALLRPLFGSGAETALAFAWPMALLALFLYLVARLSIALAGPLALMPAMVIPALSPSVRTEFSPGRLDHHNVQMILLVLLVWCTIEAVRRPRMAMGAGLAAATALAIGTEGLPGVVSAVAAFGLLWVFWPGHARAMRMFGLAFGLGTLAHLAIARPPARWLEPACDMISPVFALAALGVGAIFVVLSAPMTAGWRAWQRMAAGTGLGLILIGLVLAFYPQCLAGPYGNIDPWLVENWIDRILEARPIWESFDNLAPYLVAITLPALAALGIVAYRLTHERGDARARWLVLAIFIVVACIIMVVQVRGARLLSPLLVPAGASLILAARQHYLAHLRSPLAIAGLVGSWLLFAGMFVSSATGFAEARWRAMTTANETDTGQRSAPASPDKRPCLMPGAFKTLAGMPPARAMTPIDLGAHVLAYTPHSVVAAPYHRNEDGVRDTFRFWSGPLEETRAILRERGISLIVLCPALPELRAIGAADANAFLRLWNQDGLPDWIEPLPNEGPLELYAVRP